MMLDWTDSDSSSDAGTACVTDSPASVVDEIDTTSPEHRNDTQASQHREELVPFIEEEQSPSITIDDFGTVLGLELHNFKSYFGTVRISNITKFTAIVGPNGCGKSNIMDAISFVLCVSSTVLRGMNLKDFIYKSQQNRPPVTEAHVSLTLKGAYRPVVFQRQISASGAVSYFVDDRAISFKQYKETLGEYRINTLGSTGLIFQGAVNDIASRTPIELTRLFESISGSALYARPYNYIKEKLERRRMEYRDMLSRKKSLQQELRQYRLMISRGLNYDEVLSRYKKVEAKKYACEFRVRQIKFFEQKEEYEKLLQSNAKLTERWSSMQVKRDELERKRSSLYFEQGQLHRVIQKKQKELIAKKESMHNYYETKATLEREISELDNFRTSLESDYERLQSEHEDLSAQESELQKAIQQDLQEIEQLNSCNIKLTDRQQQRYNELLQSFNKSTSTMRIKINLCNSKMYTISSERDQLQSELVSLKGYCEKLRENFKSHSTMHESLCTRLRETKDSIELLAMTKSRLEHERKQVESRRCELQTEKETLDEHLKMLNVAKVEYRQILRRRQYTQELINDIPGVHGEVLSLCEITNACYHNGIMAALNTRGHMIVTDNLSTIQACIARLQKDKTFKRDFFPLDSLKQGKSDNRARIAEFMRSKGLRVQYTFAIDCLIFQRKYASLFEHLLGETIIVHNLDDAEGLVSSEKGALLSFNIVTQKGQVITRDRTIIIDSALYCKNSQIELELAEFGRLTLKSERLEHDLHALARKLATAESSQQDAISKLQKHQRAVELLQMKADFSMKHKDALETQVRESEEKISSLLSRISELDSEFQTLRMERDKDQIILDSIQQTHFEELNLDLGVDDVYAMLDSRLDKVTRMESQLERKRGHLSRNINDKKELENLMARIKDSSMPETIKKHEAALDNLQNLLKENQALYRELTNLEKDLAAEEESFNDFSRQIENCHEQIKLVQYEYDYLYEDGNIPGEKNGITGDTDSNRVLPLSEFKEKVSCKLLELVSSLKELQRSSIELSEQCRLRNVEVAISVPDSLRATTETDFIPDFPTMDDTRIIEDIADSTGELERNITKLENEMQSLRKSLSTSRACDGAESRMQRAQLDSEKLENDIAAAKSECSNLEADFDRIKKERTGLFMNCFQKVKRLVGPIYKGLTAQDESDEMSGGSAFLTLDDDISGSVSEPFLCSIRYNTMPPMKKFLDISLQSGGEKALSSLALLLSLHCFRKSPFVVLDEIDANLDSVKVQSLVSFLQRSSFQVIIISLKPKLFSRADVLVGVYSKQETSSSNCVVLKLCDFECRSTSPRSTEQQK